MKYVENFSMVKKKILAYSITPWRGWGVTTSGCIYSQYEILVAS